MRLLINSILILASLYLGLILVEIIVSTKRSFDPPATTSYYPWTFVTRDGRPVSQLKGPLKLASHPALVFHNFPNQRTAQFSIDSRGFRRTRPDSHERSFDQLVFLTGGSTAFGTGLPRDEDTLAANLERVLPGTKVVNAAVIGHQSGQELIRFVTDGIQLEPKVVLSVSGYNDCLGNINDPRHQLDLGYTGMDQIDNRLRVAYKVTEQSFILRAYRALTKVLLLETVRRFVPRSSIENDSLADKSFTIFPPTDVAKVFAQNMLKIDKVASAVDARFISVLQPEIFLDSQGNQVENPEHDYYKECRDAIKVELKRSGVEVVDINELQIGLRREHYLDNVHLTGEGYRLLATFLAKHLSGS